MEPKVKTIYERIISVMDDIAYVAKEQKMVNGQYRFVSHDAVTAKLHPLFVKHGIVCHSTVESYKQEGNRTEVLLRVTFINADTHTDFITGQWIGYGIDGGDKGPGKAISYAFKYAMLKTFCLETGDDPDQNAEAVYEPPKCLQFNSSLPMDFSQAERNKVEAYVKHCAEVVKKHPEDIKQEALTRMSEFLNSYRNWKTQQKK